MERFGSLILLYNSSADTLPEELTVTTLHDPPFMYAEESPDGSFTYSGYLVDVWDIVCERLNVTYRMLPPVTTGVGVLLPDGSWTGMVGELVEERADVALSWLFYREDRAEVVEYVDKVPVFTGGYQFYLRADGDEAVQLTGDMFNALLKPLHTNVWIMLLLFILLLGVALTLSVRLNRGRGETEKTCREFSPVVSTLLVSMTVAGQSWRLLPESCSARIIVISSWIMGILISTNYTAILVSCLASRPEASRPEAPIQSLDEFVSRPVWAFATENGIGVLNDWATSSSAAERHLHRRVTEGDRFLALDGTEENMRRATGPRTLLFFNGETIRHLIQDDACQLVTLPTSSPWDSESIPSYIVMRKGKLRLKRKVNDILHRMLQAGVLSRLRRRWFGHGRQMCGGKLASVPAPTLADLLAVLVITPLAAAVSCLLLAAELLARRLGQMVLRAGSTGPPGRIRELRGVITRRRRCQGRTDANRRTKVWAVPVKLVPGRRLTVRMLK